MYDFSIVAPIEEYAVFIVSPSGVLQNWNIGATRMLGYDASAIIGQKIDVLFLSYQEEVAVLHKGLVEEAIGKGTASADGWLMHKDRSRVWVNLSLTGLKNDVGVVCAFTGIARRKNKPTQYHTSGVMAPLLNSVDTLLAYWDKNGICHFANQAYKMWFGKASTDLIGKVHIKELLGTSYANHEKYITAVLRGETQIVEGQVLLHSGEVRNMVTCYQPDYKHDSVEGFFVQSFDVTEYKNMKNMLDQQLVNVKRNEDKHHRMIAEIRDYAIIFLDVHGKVENWNAGAEHLKGYKAEEIVGKHFSVFYTQNECENRLPEQLLKQAAEEGSAYHEGLKIKKGGTVFQSSVLINSIRDEAGHLTGFFKITRDLTDQKNAEESLKELSDRLMLATKSGGIGIWDYDLVENKMIWDERMMALYGINDTFDALNAYETWLGAIHPEDLNLVSDAAGAALQGIKEFDAEFRIVWSDGTIRHIKAYADVIKDQNGQAIRMVGTNWDITPQKTAELELKKSNERNKIFIEQAPNAIAMFDTDLCYLAASQKWRADYSLGDIALIGRSHYDVFPEIGDEWKRIHQECLKGAINIVDEVCFERADGTSQWITWEVRPWYLSGQKMGGILMYTADITNRKKAEELLSDTSRLAKVGGWDVNLVNGSVNWTAVTKAIREVAPDFEPSIQAGLSFYKEGSSRNSISKAVKDAMEKGIPWDLELEIVTATGKTIWARVIGKVDFSNGKCRRMYGTFQDINDRKLTELHLLKVNHELSAILDSSHVAIIGTDLEGTITHFNKGAENLLLYRAEEMIGIHSPTMVHLPEELSARGEALSPVMGRVLTGFEVLVAYARQGRYDSREWSYVRKDGKRFPVHLIVTAIKGEKGTIKGFLGVAIDITKRKLAEEKLEHSLTSLEAKNKELEQFIYIASHDLQEPLRTISSYMGIIRLKDMEKMDEISQMGIKFILEATERMSDLIKGLLDYGRLGRNVALQQIDCQKVATAVCQDLDASISEAKAQVVFERLPTIKGYETEFRLLIQNLLGNALKFRKKGVDTLISIKAQEKNNHWLFSVKDNGIGIQPEFKTKIFTIFQRLNSRDDYEGTGIGLAHCKKIVDLHKGDIWVESEWGLGSDFKFTISKNLN